MALTGLDANHGLAGEHLVWPTAITPAPQATLTKPPDMTGTTGRIGPEPLIDMDDERERTRSLPDEPGSGRAPPPISGSGRAPSTSAAPCHSRRPAQAPGDVHCLLSIPPTGAFQPYAELSDATQPYVDQQSFSRLKQPPAVLVMTPGVFPPSGQQQDDSHTLLVSHTEQVCSIVASCACYGPDE